MKLALYSLIVSAIVALGCSGAAGDKPKTADKTDTAKPDDAAATKSAIDPETPPTSNAAVTVAKPADEDKSLEATDPAALTKRELAKLQGTWTAVSVYFKGKDPSESPGGVKTSKGTALKLIIDENRFMHADTEGGKFSIDPTKTPKWFDKTLSGRTMLGIYKFEGNRLIICTALGDERPDNWTEEAWGQMVFVYKRLAEK